MARVFLSRYQPDIKPGDGHKINWGIGETVRVIDGMDCGKLAVITSSGMSHDEAPPGVFVREGYLADDPSKRTLAWPENQIWFADAPAPQGKPKKKRRDRNKSERVAAVAKAEASGRGEDWEAAWLACGNAKVERPSNLSAWFDTVRMAAVAENSRARTENIKRLGEQGWKWAKEAAVVEAVSNLARLRAAAQLTPHFPPALLDDLDVAVEVLQHATGRAESCPSAYNALLCTTSDDPNHAVQLTCARPPGGHTEHHAHVGCTTITWTADAAVS